MSADEGRRRRRDGLPISAFAAVGDASDPDTWQLSHHKRAVAGERGKTSVEETVDWELMAAAVDGLSPRARLGRANNPGPEKVIQAVRHLAAHHVVAGRRLPDILAALI